MPDILAAILPNGMTQFFDNTGEALDGGTVEFYIPATDTPKDTWQDPFKAVLNDNPVTLDSAGRALIYGEGQYRQILKRPSGAVIWDQLTYGLIPPLEPITTGFGRRVSVVADVNMDLGAAEDDTHFFEITGTGVSIEDFGASASINAPIYLVTFTDVNTLVHDPALLICEGGADIHTQAGDFTFLRYKGAGVWETFGYSRASSGASLGLGYNSQLITASGNFAIPADANANTIFKFTALGGGGGGGGAATNDGAAASGAGSGAHGVGMFKGFTAAQNVAVVIGAAGVGGANTGANGTSGGDTTLAYATVVFFTAAKGIFGQGSTLLASNLPGGAAGQAVVSIGLSGLTEVASTLAGAQPGGASIGGKRSGIGGGNPMGTGGAEQIGGANGAPGIGYGAGGGGAYRDTTNFVGGNGMPGAVLVEWWI